MLLSKLTYIRATSQQKTSATINNGLQPSDSQGMSWSTSWDEPTASCGSMLTCRDGSNALPALHQALSQKSRLCPLSELTRTLPFVSWMWQNIYGCHGQYTLFRILEKFHIGVWREFGSVSKQIPGMAVSWPGLPRRQAAHANQPHHDSTAQMNRGWKEVLI